MGLAGTSGELRGLTGLKPGARYLGSPKIS